MGWELVPSTPGQNKARSYIETLMNRNLQYPTAPVVGLSEGEQSNVDFANSMAGNLQGISPLAMDVIKKTLEGGYDPSRSSYYNSLRQESEALKGEAASSIRRGAQKSGMLKSYPAGRLVAEDSRRRDSALMQILGQLEENERNRILQTAMGAGNAVGGQLGAVAQAQQLSQLPRQVEQQRATAQYNANLSTLLAPYQLQSPMAQAILNEQRWYYKQEEGGGGLGAIGSVAGMAAGAYLGAAGGPMGMALGASLGGSIGGMGGSAIDQM